MHHFMIGMYGGFDAFDCIQRQLEQLTAISPAYILFHYPKPVILDDRVDWQNWRFADRQEYVYESEYTFAQLAKKSEHLAAYAREAGSLF